MPSVEIPDEECHIQRYKEEEDIYMLLCCTNATLVMPYAMGQFPAAGPRVALALGLGLF